MLQPYIKEYNGCHQAHYYQYSALKTNGTAIAIASMFSDLEDGGKEEVTAI